MYGALFEMGIQNCVLVQLLVAVARSNEHQEDPQGLGRGLGLTM